MKYAEKHGKNIHDILSKATDKLAGIRMILFSGSYGPLFETQRIPFWNWGSF